MVLSGMCRISRRLLSRSLKTFGWAQARIDRNVSGSQISCTSPSFRSPGFKVLGEHTSYQTAPMWYRFRARLSPKGTQTVNPFNFLCSKQSFRSTLNTATTTLTPAWSCPASPKLTSTSTSLKPAACCRRWLTSLWMGFCWRQCRKSANIHCNWLNCSNTPTLNTGRSAWWGGEE